MTLHNERPDWHDDAACRGRLDVMFIEQGESLAPARALCSQCPVIEQCLDYALANPADTAAGVWGGASQRELRMMRKSVGRPAGPSTSERCGTDNGYQGHRRAGTQPCGPCRVAHNAYEALRRRGAA